MTETGGSQEVSVLRPTPRRIRVLLADDQPLMRSGFRMILEAQSDIDVVGEARDGEEAVAEARRLQPDVVLMDVRMPRVDGIEATRRVRTEASPAAHVLVLTMFDLDEYVYGALQAGASGFLLKDASAQHLLMGIRLVADGDELLDPAVTHRLIERYAASHRPVPSGTPDGVRQLTPREREVFALVARGLSNRQIAGELVLGESTVKTHVASILAKLAVHDRVGIVVFAYEHGLAR